MAEIFIGRLSTEFPRDTYRILVDRLWPRGISKQNTLWDEWIPDVAPSRGLRQWYHQDRMTRWPDFASRYREELAALSHGEALLHVRSRMQQGPVVLLTAANDVKTSHVPILRDFLEHAGEG